MLRIINLTLNYFYNLLSAETFIFILNMYHSYRLCYELDSYCFSMWYLSKQPVIIHYFVLLLLDFLKKSLTNEHFLPVFRLQA